QLSLPAGYIQDHPALRRHHRPDLVHKLLEGRSFASADDSQDHRVPELGLVQSRNQGRIHHAQGRVDSRIQVPPGEIRDAIDDRIGGLTDAAIECLAAARERTFTARANVDVGVRRQKTLLAGRRLLSFPPRRQIRAGKTAGPHLKPLPRPALSLYAAGYRKSYSFSDSSVALKCSGRRRADFLDWWSCMRRRMSSSALTATTM